MRSQRAKPFFILIACFLSFVCSVPLVNRKDLKKTSKFLIQFGYVDISNPADTAGAGDQNSPSFKKAIRRLQWFGGIPVTGILDRRTFELIGTSRCGMKDPAPPFSRGIGEFRLQGTYWKKRDLTYKIMNYTDDIHSRNKQQQIFREALRKWEAVSDLRIRQVYSGDADIPISFVTGDHQDGYPFDGPGGTLAHAFYPHNNEGLAGDAHFDDDERFTTGTPDGINLDWVAIHEFGHSLGLEHSNVQESIMYPWYKGFVADVKLTSDDIQGIQALYPKPTTPPTLRTTTEVTTTRRPQVTLRPRPVTPRPVTPRPVTPRPVTPRPVTPRPVTPRPVTPRPVTPRPTPPDLCDRSVRYDAVFSDPRQRKSYFFVGNWFWVVNRKLKRSDAKAIKSFWREVKTPMDAAYRNKRGNIVFFKGTEFWEYDSRRILRSSGTMTRYGLPLSLANMNAVFIWEGNQITYFFKGTQYWRYNERTRRTVRGPSRNPYPRMIRSAWRFPDHIDAAVTWLNGRSYVFLGSQYLKLKKRSLRLDGGRRNTALRWMKCSSSVGALVFRPPSDP